MNRASLPLPPRPPPRDAAEARHQDIADLKLLPDFDRSFSPEARQSFVRAADAFDADAESLTPAGFAMAVSRLVAMAGNAHTTVNKAQRASSNGRVPLRFGWFADGLYIVRTGPLVGGLLGRKVVSIDGRPVEQALADLRPYISGTAERTRDDSPPLLECPAMLQAIWPDTDGRHLAIGLADGAIEQLEALPPAPDPLALQPIMAIGPGALPEGWTSILGKAPKIPLSLQTPERIAFAKPLADGGLYVRINANEDDAEGPLAEQLAVIAAGKPADGWRRIVLDLRFNDGGDELKTMDFSARLPDLLTQDGTLWIMTGNATFSAAMITTARAKHFLGERARIVGEAVGDHNPFWSGGGAPLVLRNSGIAISHAYFKQDWANGCRDTRICSPFQFLYGVAAGELKPEVAIGWAFADYAAGRDTVMERVRDLAR